MTTTPLLAAFDTFAGAGAAVARLQRARTARSGRCRSGHSSPARCRTRSDLLSRMKSTRDLRTIDAMRSLNDAARALFDEPRLQQWLGRYATYSGSTPRAAPATLSCIPHVEAEHGCWYPMGGLGALCDALRARCWQGWVSTFRPSSDVSASTKTAPA